MILIVAMLMGLPLSPVRAELVEALPFLSEEKNGPSTSSGRTEAKDQSPIDAERAFAADANAIGQWTAFRKWSADDAVMFVPQPTNAHEFLKDRKDPPKVIDWWPTASWISCDGKLAVNTGGWTRPDGSVGYFSTVWQKQPDGGWKWIVDGGDGLATPRERPASPTVKIAKCVGPTDFTGPADVRIPDAKSGSGAAADHSLRWWWAVMPNGERKFSADYFDGAKFVTAIDDKITGSPANK